MMMDGETKRGRNECAWKQKCRLLQVNRRHRQRRCGVRFDSDGLVYGGVRSEK